MNQPIPWHIAEGAIEDIGVTVGLSWWRVPLHDATEQEVACIYDADLPTARTRAQLLAHAPQLQSALRTLVGADNCNYSRDTMRYCEYFDAARTVLLTATGEDLSRPEGATNDPLLRALEVLTAACEATHTAVPPDATTTHGESLRVVLGEALACARTFRTQAEA